MFLLQKEVVFYKLPCLFYSDKQTDTFFFTLHFFNKIINACKEQNCDRRVETGMKTTAK